MFAIVDIETTGGYASANGITEIAIVLHNGREVEGKYETLVNPESPIDRYVQALTGITNEMVASAPVFKLVAPNIFNLLKDRVFVAHNVNFDYSFVKHHLLDAGYDLDVSKLCTIRLARKIFPGLPKYGLGTVCRELEIPISDRHRAAGDALATAQLFQMLVDNDKTGELEKMMKRHTGQQWMPPNLPSAKLKGLPFLPGVYYFHDKAGKVIYIGKAKSLKKRITSHFSNNKLTKQKQEFLRHIYDITYQVCGTELMAAIRESIEIRRLWPQYNKSQKHFEHVYALYLFEDSKGFYRLGIDNKKKQLQALYTFHIMEEGRQMLKSIVKQFDLCPRLCFIDNSPGPSLAETRKETAAKYNKRVEKALHYLKEMLPSFAIVEDGGNNIRSCVLVEKGRFTGMGELPDSSTADSIIELKSHIELQTENAYIRQLVYQYAEKYPAKKLAFEHTT